MTAKPNFLLFITDQHRADHLGCYGNKIVRTENIDALAASGMRFDRAYVTNPVCMPNRGSLMTGRMPSVHGARSNGVPLPLGSVTFMDLLSAAGYRTALVGKSHLQTMDESPAVLPSKPKPEGVAPLPGFEEAHRDGANPKLYEQELRSSWEQPNHHLELPYYGFQEVVLCNHHGDECFGDYLRWLRDQHPDVAGRIGREHGTIDPRYVAPQAWKTNLDEFTYPTHYIATETSRWIREHAARHPEQPFALMCSFPDPHHPWTPPGRYWDMYEPEAMPLPSTFHSDPAALPKHVRWLLEERRSNKARLDGPRMFAVNEREIREMIALTYGMITNIDDRVGLVMQTLREVGADDNTVVIFTSDHGDLMGDHGIVLKGPLHYQGLIRVPVIWRETRSAREASGRVSQELVSTMDLPASIIQRAGIELPNGVQGVALVTPEGDSLPAGRDAVLIEENQQRAYLGFEQPVRVRTLVTATHRLSLFEEGDWGELYDLQSDPGELINLWDDDAAFGVKASLLQRLGQLLISHSESSPRPARLA